MPLWQKVDVRHDQFLMCYPNLLRPLHCGAYIEDQTWCFIHNWVFYTSISPHLILGIVYTTITFDKQDKLPNTYQFQGKVEIHS